MCLKRINCGRVELRQLEYFVAVAEESHFGRAAARCHIAPSGLSASIRALEQDLGAQLFTRTTRSVRLTDTGQALLTQARRTVDAAGEARRAVASVKGLQRGRLRVGVLQGMEAVDLAGVLGRYHHRHPEIELHLVQGATADLLDAVRGGTLDLAFIGVHPADTDGIHARRVISQPLLVACSRRHPFARRRTVHLRELAQEPLVAFPPSWGFRIITDTGLASHGVHPPIVAEVNDITTATALVAAELGVALIPPWNGPTTITTIPLQPPALIEHITVIHRRAATLSYAARALLDELDHHLQTRHEHDQAAT